MKKYLSLFCTVVLAVCSLCSCGPQEAVVETETLQSEAEQPPQSMTIAEITAIDGTTAILSLWNNGHGMPVGEMPGGERPEMPEGERPEMPEGERPEMPEGERPEMPKDERPEQQTLAVDLSDFDTIDASSVDQGDLLELEIAEDGSILSLKKADLSQLPDFFDKKDSAVS